MGVVQPDLRGRRLGEDRGAPAFGAVFAQRFLDLQRQSATQAKDADDVPRAVAARVLGRPRGAGGEPDVDAVQAGLPAPTAGPAEGDFLDGGPLVPHPAVVAGGTFDAI